MQRALDLGLELNAGQDASDRWLWLAGGRIFQMVAMDLWDDESWHALATGHVDLARGTGAIMHLTFALNYLARIQILAGNLVAADGWSRRTSSCPRPLATRPIVDTAMLLAAWRGQDQRRHGAHRGHLTRGERSWGRTTGLPGRLCKLGPPQRLRA